MNEIALCIKNQLRIDGLTQTNSPQVLRIQNTKLDYNEHKASYLKLPTDSNRKPSFLSRVFLLLPFFKTRWMTQSLPSNSPFLLSPAFLLLPSFSSSSRNDIVAYQYPLFEIKLVLKLELGILVTKLPVKDPCILRRRKRTPLHQKLQSSFVVVASIQNSLRNDHQIVQPRRKCR